MSLVIDTCCIAMVFNPTNTRHADFKPVFDWINTGKGFMIYGGTKYKVELSRLAQYLGIIAELKRKGRVLTMLDTTVDTVAAELKTEITDSAFNDEHIVAIVIVSKCRVVCTDDSAAIPYLKRTDVYTSRGMQRPKIYKAKRHRTLCCDKNVI